MIVLSDLELGIQPDPRLVDTFPVHINSGFPQRVEIGAPGQGAYLDAIMGDPDDVSETLYEDGWPGLANRIANVTCPVAYIELLEVRPRLRGYGIGGALLQRTLNAFKSLGVCKVFLHAAPMRGKRDELFKFYRTYGFEKVDCCLEDRHPVFEKKFR
jgi:GNAT superfamily N-acetyltransferase